MPATASKCEVGPPPEGGRGGLFLILIRILILILTSHFTGAAGILRDLGGKRGGIPGPRINYVLGWGWRE